MTCRTLWHADRGPRGGSTAHDTTWTVIRPTRRGARRVVAVARIPFEPGLSAEGADGVPMRHGSI